MTDGLSAPGAGSGAGIAASAGSASGSAPSGPALTTIFIFTLAAVFAGRRLLAGNDMVPPAPLVRWVERPG
jgi:hypothetical protein